MTTTVLVPVPLAAFRGETVTIVGPTWWARAPSPMAPVPLVRLDRVWVPLAMSSLFEWMTGHVFAEPPRS